MERQVAGDARATHDVAVQPTPEDPSGPRPSSLPTPAAILVVDDDAPRLSVAAAARRLGVAPATLRTWDRRYGIGPSSHTPGRHRRYSPNDLARLQLMHQALLQGATSADAARYALSAREQGPPLDRILPEPDLIDAGPDALHRTVDGGPRSAVPRESESPVSSLVGGSGEVVAQVRSPRPPSAGSLTRGLGRAALALDAAAVHSMLVESVAESGIEFTWNEMAQPVLAAVADRWAHTGMGIEIEHLLSESVRGVFGAVAAAATVHVDSRPVLVAGMPGEHHTLALVVLAATLAQRGVACRSLGPDLPGTALAGAIRRTAPAGVVLWSQLAPTADADVLLSLPRMRPPYRLFVAGPGWDGVELPERIGRLASLVEATDLISAAVGA